MFYKKLQIDSTTDSRIYVFPACIDYLEEIKNPEVTKMHVCKRVIDLKGKASSIVYKELYGAFVKMIASKLDKDSDMFIDFQVWINPQEVCMVMDERVLKESSSLMFFSGSSLLIRMNAGKALQQIIKKNEEIDNKRKERDEKNTN